MTSVVKLTKQRDLLFFQTFHVRLLLPMKPASVWMYLEELFLICTAWLLKTGKQ